MTHTANILPFDGEAYYYPSVFTAADQQRYFRSLTDEVPWKQEPVRIFGKQIMQPRLTAFYGDHGKTYAYAGVTMHPLNWTPDLSVIRTVAEQLAGAHFTSALLNLYRDGNDSMGWHRDNEKMLGPKPLIASVSFGDSRKFQFRNYLDKSRIVSMILEPGSVLIMAGLTQQHWEHRLPKNTRADAARINITYRII